MKIPTRLLVQYRLCELFTKEPLVINGESYDMTDYVWRGRNLIGEEVEPLPILSILESPRPDFALYAGDSLARRDYMTLLITGRIEKGCENNQDPAYWFEAAVEERLSRVLEMKGSGTAKYPESYMLGDLIAGLEVGAPVVRPPDDKASKAAYFFLPIRAGIAVRLDAPYTEAP